MKGWKSLAAMAALAVVAAACGSDSPTAPRTAQKLDVDALLGQMAAGDFTQNSSAQAALSLPTASGLSRPSAASCSFDSGTQGFACAPVDAGGLHFTLTYWLYDAAGQALTTLDAAKTASIRTVSDISGTLAPSSGTTFVNSTISAHSDMTLSGLLTGTHTLNGTSNSHYDMRFDGTTQAHTVMDDTSHTANVIVPSTPSNGGYWPSAGTITSDTHFGTTSGSLPPMSFATHSVLTFQGSGKMTIALTLDGVTSTCTIDLSSKGSMSCTN
ncbi:MAG TPA: hypothetical protein VHB25_04175 [Gemmatimonadaceae bacterium]|nr:hypothetical protein [Gemmatimonadaceae bacterium]